MNNSNLATFILLLLSTICGVITLSLTMCAIIFKDNTFEKAMMFFATACILFRLTGVLNQYFENK